MEFLGLLGFPVAHSFSQKMHHAVIEHLGLNLEYKLFNVPPDKLAAAVDGIRMFGIKGVNVTVPHKTAVMSFLDEIDSQAILCGAVNTIVNTEQGLIGYNTDYIGINEALLYHGFSVKGKNILMLGSGGAARAVIVALQHLEVANIYIANRTMENVQILAQTFEGLKAVPLETNALNRALKNIDGVINTTTVGMHPNVDVAPLLSANQLSGVEFVYDIIYNPTQTNLLKEAERAGCAYANGIEMLVRQGAESFYLWTGIKPPLDIMRRALA